MFRTIWQNSKFMGKQLQVIVKGKFIDLIVLIKLKIKEEFNSKDK